MSANPYQHCRLQTACVDSESDASCDCGCAECHEAVAWEAGRANAVGEIVAWLRSDFGPENGCTIARLHRQVADEIAARFGAPPAPNSGSHMLDPNLKDK